MRLNNVFAGLPVNSDFRDIVCTCFFIHMIQEEAATMQVLNQSNIKPSKKPTGEESVLWHITGIQVVSLETAYHKIN